MLTTFDTNTILFKLLNGNIEINGGVYKGDERPEDSDREDIVVNTISLSQTSSPQIGTSNINVYCPDKTKKINGKVQLSANTKRLDALTKQVLTVLRNTVIPECTATPGDMTLMYDPPTKQHFVNIRVDWNIQTP